MNARITLISGNSLCRNPRVLKEAACLVEAGFEVEVLGAWTTSGHKSEDEELLEGAKFRFTPVVDVGNRRAIDNFLRFAHRATTKCSRWSYQAFGTSNRWQLGPTAGPLGRAARARPSELAIAHSEAGLLVVADLERRGQRVGVDMEDWFSEDLLPEARRGRPIGLLRDCERRILLRGRFTSCPSLAMSRGLVEAYSCPAPEVIYNSFPWSDRATLDGRSKDREGRRRPSIHWYSQTLGIGRGLEDLIAALPFVLSEAEIHLRGQMAEDFADWLLPRIPGTWRDRVFVHGLVPNSELLSRIAEHDIGFAGEMKYCKSRDFTVTNKILQYLLAGLAVVASDTAGQREVAGLATGAVSLYPIGDYRALAARINDLLASPDRLQAAQRAALAAAERKFCWERQRERIVSGVQAALEASGERMC